LGWGLGMARATPIIYITHKQVQAWAWLGAPACYIIILIFT